MSTVTIVVDSMAHMPITPDLVANKPLLETIRNALVFANPVYEQVMRRRGMPPAGVDPEVKVYIYNRETGVLSVPRGFVDQLYTLLQGQGYNPTVTDRTALPHVVDGYQANYTLRPYQVPAINAMMGYSHGTLIAPCGSGKTTMGLHLVQAHKRPALWVTHTKRLAKQTEERARELLGLSEIGIIGDGQVQISPGLTIALVQTLIRQDLEALANRWGTIVYDECLVAGTLVTLADGGLKPIEQISSGDQVQGGTVSDPFSRKAPTWLVRTCTGTLETSYTHPMLIVRRQRDAHKNQWCSPSGADVQVVSAEDVRPRDLLLVPSQAPHTIRNDWTADALRFVALITCDGHINQTEVKVSVRKDVDWYRETFARGMAAFGYSGDFAEYMNARGDTTFRTANKLLRKVLQTRFGIPAGKKSDRVHVSDQVMYAPLDAIAGYLDGCFSCEGDVQRNQAGSWRLFFNTTSERLATEIQHLLLKFGIHSTRLFLPRQDPEHADIHRISIGGGFLKRLHNAVGGLTLHRKNVLPEQIIGRGFSTYQVEYEGSTYYLTEVKESSPTGREHTVYDFTTTNHTFIANNLLTHNCHHIPAVSFARVANALAARYRYGLTANTARADGLYPVVLRLIGPIRHEITQAEVERSGGTMTPDLVRVETGRRYRDKDEDESDYQFAGLMVKECARDDARNEVITNMVARQPVGSRTLILVQLVEHAERLADMLREYYGIKASPFHGGLGTKRTAQVDREFRDGRLDALVGTLGLAKEGLDYPFLTDLHLAAPMRDPEGVKQAVGRVMRSHPGKTRAVVYDYVDAGPDLLINQARDRMRVFRRLGLRQEGRRL